jgi:autophagy-related protein 18
LGYISNYGRRALAQSASYWPSVADMMTQWRSFAIARLPLLSGSRNVCAVANIQKIPRVLIASADGYLYIYDLNVNEGGDCTLIKQHRFQYYYYLNNKEEEAPKYKMWTFFNI